MKTSYKTSLYSLLFVSLFGLLSACGGSSGSSNSNNTPEPTPTPAPAPIQKPKEDNQVQSVIGTWKTACYEKENMKKFAKNVLGIDLPNQAKSGNLEVTFTKEEIQIAADIHTGSNCKSGITVHKNEICTYSEEGKKIAASGNEATKIKFTCKKKKALIKQLYLVKDKKLYFGDNTKDNSGYPNDIGYDFYLTK